MYTQGKKRTYRIYVALMGLLVFAVTNQGQAGQELEIKLSQAEEKVIATSPDLKEANLVIESVIQSKNAVQKSRLPQILLEGSATYLETIAEVQAGPLNTRLGDNENYSIGPTLTWNLWDGGVKKDLQKSLELLSEAQKTQAEGLKENLILNLRLEYLKAIISKEEMSLVEQRLKIVDLQNKDINTKRREGASSNLDLAESKRELYRYQLELENKKEALKGSVISLLHLTGELEKTQLLESQDFFLRLKLDTLDDLISRLGKLAQGKLTEKNPAVLAHKLKAESLYKEAESARSKNWPTVNFRARTSLDYPNGPRLEQFNQNTVGLTLTMPLIDWGKTNSDATSKNAQARAEEQRAKKSYEDKLKAWQTLKAEIQSLKNRLTISEQLVAESAKVTKIKTESYRSGRISFTDLETAHFKELESRFELLRIKSLIFSNYSLLASLSAGDEKS